MAQLRFGSAGVSVREIDLSTVVTQQPTGIPASVIGTANAGPAFVPVTVGIVSDFTAKFGETDGKKFGPLAVHEWLRNAGSVTYLRVLGVGNGKNRLTDGSVLSSGFTVGEEQPRSSDGQIVPNPYANSGQNSTQGRTYFLGALMSESAGSTLFSSAGIQGAGSVTPGVDMSVPIVRGVLMAASGVIMRLSSSSGVSDAPNTSLIATDINSNGALYGVVDLSVSGQPRQNFVLILNGHKGTDPLYRNVITASFDMESPNYFANIFNRDPSKLQQAGYYLYSSWDVHPKTAVITGSSVVVTADGAGAVTAPKFGSELAAFITTGSLPRDTGNSVVPNYESWTTRFSHAKSPWVTSQKFGGKAMNLFRLHALDAGANISTGFKISVENISTSTDPANKYGTFDVVIREWDDNDANVRPIEQWRGLTLDQSSDRFISKVIGDTNIYYDFDRSEYGQKIVVDGNYPNRSNYVRVEVSSDVESESIDATALPLGFRGIAHLVTSGSQPLASPLVAAHAVDNVLKRAIIPPLPMRPNLVIGTGAKQSVNPQLYWGVQFEHTTTLTNPNISSLKNSSLQSYAKFYPDFSTINQNFVASDNNGSVDTDALGVIDADRFCTNAFSLENIQVVTGSNGLADTAQWVSAQYVRRGNIVSNETNKTRGLSIDDLSQANRRFLKYTMFLQGGFDGVNLFDKDESEINNVAVTADMNSVARGRDQGPSVKAYMKALDIIKNVVNVDTQLLVMPGIRNPVVTNAAVNAVENRFDALYIMDIEQRDMQNNLVTADNQLPSVQYTAQAFKDRTLDSSFAAAYFPDAIIQDPTTLTNVVVPPSVVVLGALALNDAVGHPWFAPAGFQRGALQTTLEARVQLSKTNMDELYDINVNPLVAFPGNATSGTNPKGGVTVWGQKTLQASASALDRVNVRRLLIDIRRQVRDIAQSIIFEPNRETTLAKFSSLVTPRLQRIQSLAGLERFRVIIDSSTTTQADVENNTIRGKIFVQPTKSIEFVSLDFVVSNNITQG